MSISFYQILHLLGLVSFVSALSILLLKPEKSKIASIVFGISSLIIFVAGFGMLAKLGYSMASVWVIGKLLIWTCLAVGIPYVVKRMSSIKRMVFIGSMLLICIAVILAILKPY